MNPLTNVKNLQKLNDRELELGIIGKKSWHDEYKDSAWIFTGGLPYDLSEGDIICVFSQYGEIVNINLVRDSKTGKSKGYAFICYQDQRSTVLAVDNLNGIKILGRIIRVDHVKDYKMPKERGDEDETTLKLRQEGCAPKIESSPEEVEEVEDTETTKKKKKEKKKKVKKEKKKKKKKDRDSSEEVDSDSNNASDEKQKDIKEEKFYVKEEKIDSGYDKALHRYSTKTTKDSDYSGDRKSRRIDDYNINADRLRNGVKEERWGDSSGDRRLDVGGSDRRRDGDTRGGWCNQRYDRGRDSRGEDDRNTDRREYNERLDRDRRDEWNDNNRREFRTHERDQRDRDGYRNENSRQREDGRYSWTENGGDGGGSSSSGSRRDEDGWSGRQRQQQFHRSGEGERRKDRRSRSRSKDRSYSYSKRRAHRSRSRSASRER